MKYVTAWDAAVVRLCAGSATWWAPRIAPPKNPGCFGASCTRYLACCARSGRFKRGVFATNRSHAFRRLEDCYYSLVHYPLLNRIRIHLFAHLQNISRDRPARERMTRRGASLPGWVRPESGPFLPSQACCAWDRRSLPQGLRHDVGPEITHGNGKQEVDACKEYSDAVEDGCAISQPQTTATTAGAVSPNF